MLHKFHHYWFPEISHHPKEKICTGMPYFITLLFIDFPGGSDGKASAYNAGDSGSISGLGRSSGEGNGNPLQYSCLDNPMDGGVHRVAKSRTRLSDFTSLHLVGSLVDRFVHFVSSTRAQTTSEKRMFHRLIHDFTAPVGNQKRPWTGSPPEEIFLLLCDFRFPTNEGLRDNLGFRP